MIRKFSSQRGCVRKSQALQQRRITQFITLGLQRVSRAKVKRVGGEREDAEEVQNQKSPGQAGPGEIGWMIRARGTGTRHVSRIKMQAELRSWEQLGWHFLSLGAWETLTKFVDQVADTEEILT